MARDGDGDGAVCARPLMLVVMAVAIGAEPTTTGREKSSVDHRKNVYTRSRSAQSSPSHTAGRADIGVRAATQPVRQPSRSNRVQGHFRRIAKANGRTDANRKCAPCRRLPWLGRGTAVRDGGLSARQSRIRGVLKPFLVHQRANGKTTGSVSPCLGCTHPVSTDIPFSH